MPMARFPKQTLTMLENDLDSTSNWAGNIKHCLDSYGFHDVWTDGAADETSFLSAFKSKTFERFQGENGTRKCPTVTDFFAFCTFKSIHVAEKQTI